jgi:hypothetical protein
MGRVCELDCTGEEEEVRKDWGQLERVGVADSYVDVQQANMVQDKGPEEQKTNIVRYSREVREVDKTRQQSPTSHRMRRLEGDELDEKHTEVVQPTKPQRAKRKKSSKTVRSDSEKEESEVEEESVEMQQWGANPKECVPGSFAVCSTVWGGGERGVEIVKITEVEGEEFKGELFVCTKPTYCKECVGGSWRKKKGGELQTNEKSQVVTYFKYLLTSGQLPTTVKRTLDRFPFVGQQ